MLSLQKTIWRSNQKDVYSMNLHISTSTLKSLDGNSESIFFTLSLPCYSRGFKKALPSHPHCYHVFRQDLQLQGEDAIAHQCSRSPPESTAQRQEESSEPSLPRKVSYSKSRHHQGTSHTPILHPFSNFVQEGPSSPRMSLQHFMKAQAGDAPMCILHTDSTPLLSSTSLSVRLSLRSASCVFPETNSFCSNCSHAPCRPLPPPE